MKVTREILEQIAALLAPASGGYARVSFGDAEQVADLQAMGGESRGFVTDGGKVIIACELQVGGVSFEAQFSRPATDEERAQLCTDAAIHHRSLVTALVQP